MTKLEQKLLQLGYRSNEANEYRFWVKRINNKCYIYIYLNEDKTHILNKNVDRMLYSKQDYLEAYDVMQKDLEEIKKYEQA